MVLFWEIMDRILSEPALKRKPSADGQEKRAAPVSQRAGRRLDSLPRLAEAGALDFQVGIGPYLLESGVDRRRLVRLPLAAQAVGQAVERPAVFGQAFQIVAVDLLGLGEPAGLHQ